MGNWYSSTKVVVNQSDDPDVALIESLRLESGKPTVLDQIPDGLLLSAFTARNITLEDKVYVLASIRTRLKPLAVALEAADTVQGVYGVIERIDDYPEVRSVIRAAGDANLKMHANASNRIDHMRVGILLAVVDIEAVCIQRVSQN